MGTGDGRYAPVEHALLSVGLLVDAVVREQHDDTRHPERHAGRHDSVLLVDDERAHVRVTEPFAVVRGRRVPAGEYRRERYEHGRHPHRGQHDHRPGLGHDQRIVERLNDGVVPVHADAAQVKYGHGGEVHVHRVPHVAHEPAEHPAAGQLEAGVEAHGEYGHQHVGQGQRHDEVVGDHPQLAVPHHAHHDQQVAEQRGHHYEAHGRALGHVTAEPRLVGQLVEQHVHGAARNRGRARPGRHRRGQSVRGCRRGRRGRRRGDGRSRHCCGRLGRPVYRARGRRRRRCCGRREHCR